MNKAKLGVVGALVIGGIATPLAFRHQEHVKLRSENELLRQRVEQLAPLEAENARLERVIAEAPQAPTQDDSSNEVLRLRGEVARLREDVRELAHLQVAAVKSPVMDDSLDAAAQNLAARAAQLRDRLEQAPQTKIPEMQFLTERDWLNASGSVKQLESDEDFRRALSSLRSRAKSTFGGMMQKAMRQFVEANGGTLPTELSQLQPYLDSPVDPALLDRYSLVATARDPRHGKALITENAPPVDDEYDSHFEFSINSSNSRTVNKTAAALETAAVAYAQDNRGLLPIEPSQVAPYLQQPMDSAVVKEFLSKRLPHVAPLDQPKIGK